MVMPCILLAMHVPTGRILDFSWFLWPWFLWDDGCDKIAQVVTALSAAVLDAPCGRFVGV